MRGEGGPGTAVQSPMKGSRARENVGEDAKIKGVVNSVDLCRAKKAMGETRVETYIYFSINHLPRRCETSE